jgi:hypothetical protein
MDEQMNQTKPNQTKPWSCSPATYEAHLLPIHMESFLWWLPFRMSFVLMYVHNPNVQKAGDWQYTMKWNLSSVCFHEMSRRAKNFFVDFKRLGFFRSCLGAVSGKHSTSVNSRVGIGSEFWEAEWSFLFTICNVILEFTGVSVSLWVKQWRTVFHKDTDTGWGYAGRCKILLKKSFPRCNFETPTFLRATGMAWSVIREDIWSC